MNKKPESSEIPMEMGNPDFNLNDVEPSNALAALTPEDMAFEASLQSMNQEPPPPIESDPTTPVQKMKDESHLLSDYMEGVRPASTVNELMEQVHMAKQMDCDSIEATSTLIKHYCRKDFAHIEKSVGYFMFHDIKVHIAGHFDKASKQDKMTIQQKLFGNSTTETAPIMGMEYKK